MFCGFLGFIAVDVEIRVMMNRFQVQHTTRVLHGADQCATPIEGLYQIACTARHVDVEKTEGPEEGRSNNPEVIMFCREAVLGVWL